VTATPTVLLSHALPPADSPDMQAALAGRPLPFLRRWFQSSMAQHIVQTSPEDRAMPVELARAEILNWTTPQTPLPWAALAAREAAHREGPDGESKVTPITDDPAAWAFVSLCHWQVGNGQFTLLDAGPVSEHESQALLASMRPYFEEDGITLVPFEPGRWLARSALFDGLLSASLPRVLGLPIEPWLLGADLPELSSPIRTLRRLQNEMQMLLYQHPVNDARLARGQLPINSFWLHGAGEPRAAAAGSVVLHSELLDAAQQGPEAWRAAWQALDATQLAPLAAAAHLPTDLRLSLCSQGTAITWAPAPRPWPQRLRQNLWQWLRPVDPVRAALRLLIEEATP